MSENLICDIEKELSFQSSSHAVFKFSESDYISTVNWNDCKLSKFDTVLQNAWLSKEASFRYKLSIDDTKQIEGGYEFLAQLNINRAVNRRDPEEIYSVKQPFSNGQFNFTKIDSSEVMFVFSRDNIGDLQDLEKDFFIINVSPLEKFHCLLCPKLYKCLNQIVTEESLHMALNTLLLSSTPEIRVGFNSLCGFATVNHLHFHAYYLNTPMKLETIKVDLFSGRCHVLEEYPSKGFVFQLTSPADISIVVRDIFCLTNFLTNQNIAHNIYMTRGLKFERSALGEETSERDVIRIFVWARISSYGAKTLDALQPAMCELFGHLVVKTKEGYDKLDEENVASMLHFITYGPYMRIKESVKELFQ